MPDVIYTYNEFESYGKANPAVLFWIVEYRNATGVEQYSLMRNECLSNPQTYKDRLNNGVYRIWTTTPRTIEWK